MKQLFLTGAALSAALLAGQANAVIPLIGNVPDIAGMRTAGMVEARFAGASAPTPIIEKAFLNNCAGGVAYKFSNGTSSFAWVCENGGTVAALPVTSFPYLMLQKRDSGGSVTGVVAASTPPGTYLGQNFGQAPFFTDATIIASTCPAAAPPVTGCTTGGATANLSASTANFADVDAAKFADALNGAIPGAANLPSSAVASQVFGVVVNLKLRDAMQNAMITAGLLPGCAVGNETEACMPNLTLAQLTTIFSSGRMTDWRNLRFSATPPAAGTFLTAANTSTALLNNSIHMCNRTTGSGTLATQYIKLTGASCVPTAEPLISAATQTIGTESGTAKVLHSMSGQGDVDNCLEGLNNGADVGTFTPYALGRIAGGAAATNYRWAIGFSSADRNANNAKPFRFIKIDNVSPTLRNVVAGRYRVWAELTQVGNTNSFPTADSATLANDIITNMRNADQIAGLKVAFTWGDSGLLGIASSTAFAPTGTNIINGLTSAGYDPLRPVNPYTHGPSTTANGSGIDHCRWPTIPAGTRAMPVFYPAY